jgi:hypothetical protein
MRGDNENCPGGGASFWAKAQLRTFSSQSLISRVPGIRNEGNEGNEGMLAGAALFVPGISNSIALWGDRLRVR